MRTRVLAFLSVAAVAPLLAAPTCNVGVVAGSTQIFVPGPVVDQFTFSIQVQVPVGSTFDPAADVKLNGAPILVTPDAGTTQSFSATLSAGFPLQDSNHLEARAQLPSGPSIATRDFSYAPPKARIHRITNAAELIHGPLAHGRVGDWMIENTVARFIVQDVGQRDLYSVGAFGGNIIDLELLSNPGNDNFIEIQPMLNVETVVNAQTVVVVNDGQDGTPAILRTCGPDDLLDFVNPSSTISDAGLSVPPNLDDNDQPVEACTEYRLDPGVARIRMDTAVTNIGTTQQRLIVGDWYNPGGQLETWVRPQLLGEALSTNFSIMSHFGTGQYEGLDYEYTALALNPPITTPPLPSGSSEFTTSGVSVLLHDTAVTTALTGAQAPFFVDPGASRTFSRYLGVGDGSGSNAVAMEAEVKGLSTATISGCVTVGGVPLAGSRVSVLRPFGPAPAMRQEASVITKAGACPNYSAKISLFGAAWQVMGWRLGTPYESNLSTPTIHSVTAVAGGSYTVDIALPANGRLSAHVTDENGAGLPARVAVIGIDPSPPITIDGQAGIPGFGGTTVGKFEDPKEALPFGLVAFGYSNASGDVAFDVEPGSYQLVVSRGGEYSIYSAPLTITAGSTTNATAQIARVIDTAGFISSDFHVHGIRSADSRVADEPRVSQFAGEGVENIIITDHHVHTNLLPTIAALGLGDRVTSTIGEEITTFDYGHFNGYPFTIDPNRVTGGSTDWAKAAPPGQDFPSAGAYNSTPAEIYSLATAGAQSIPGVTTIQVNHIDSHFVPLKINTALAGPITDGLDDAGRAARRLQSVAAVGNLFFAFPALELWNGSTRGNQQSFLNERIGIWMNHLNKGLRTTAISDTDTHTFGDLDTAGARTWTASSTDAVPAIDSAEVADAVRHGRAVGGQGLYVQTRLLAPSTGQVADLTRTGSTDLATTDGHVDLEIHVQAPSWVRFDTIDVYANADTVAAGNPYLYTATPTVTLQEGDCNPATAGVGFTINTVNVDPSIPGATRQEVTVTVPFNSLTNDTWFAVVVRGSDQFCQPMFPVYPRSLNTAGNTTLANLLDGNVGEGGTMALGVANALYAEVNGVPGFQPKNP